MLQTIIIFLLITLTVITNCNGVKFYNHPIPIPSSSGMSYPEIRQSPRNVGVKSSSWVDPAVQFLVNNKNDGSYHFGYDTGGSPTMYREEIREKSGRITGRYAYIDPDGILRVTEYVADHQGFRSTESQHVVFDTSDLQLIGPIPKPSRRLHHQ